MLERLTHADGLLILCTGKKQKRLTIIWECQNVFGYDYIRSNYPIYDLETQIVHLSFNWLNGRHDLCRGQKMEEMSYKIHLFFRQKN